MRRDLKAMSGELLECVGDMFGGSASGGYTFAALALPGDDWADAARPATLINDSPQLVDAKKDKKEHKDKNKEKDKDQRPSHTRKGDWQTVEGEGYGGEYSYVVAGGKSEPSATWTLEGLEPGKTYQVLVTWVADPANATSTTWTIADGSGGSVLLSISDVDQTELRPDATLGGQTWQSLAIVTATSGALVVRLDAAGSSGRVVADAVAMVEVVQAVESGQNGRDGDVVLAAAEGSGASSPRGGWFWENYAGPAIHGWASFANGLTNLINHTDNAFRWVENGALEVVNEMAMMSNYGRPVFDPIPYVEVRDWSRGIAAPEAEWQHQFNMQAAELIGGVLIGGAASRFGAPGGTPGPAGGGRFNAPLGEGAAARGPTKFSLGTFGADGATETPQVLRNLEARQAELSKLIDHAESIGDTRLADRLLDELLTLERIIRNASGAVPSVN